ncbi:MAG: DUF3467 domain-containing protein [Patescibacteria group bacterium]|jgi:hypothetical protein
MPELTANNTPQEIRIADNLIGGEYANAMQISHNKEEFIMSFFNVVPPGGRVVARVISSPGHLKNMIFALQDNLKKYEAQFGSVTQAESPKAEIGFKAE